MYQRQVIEWIHLTHQDTYTGLILGFHLPNEIRRYEVTPSLIGSAQT